jgi:hypothetical protein
MGVGGEVLLSEHASVAKEALFPAGSRGQWQVEVPTSFSALLLLQGFPQGHLKAAAPLAGSN